MAAPTVRSIGGPVDGAASVNVPMPSGFQANDILVIFVMTANQNLPTEPLTGWTNLPNIPGGLGTAGAAGGIKLRGFWKRATGSETAVATGDSGSVQLAVMLAVSGCITTGDPWDVTAGATQTATNTASFSAVNTSGTDRLIIHALAADRDNANTTDLGTWTNGNLSGLSQHVETWVATGFGGGLGVASGTKAAAGSIGTTTVSIITQAFCHWTGALLPIPPAVAQEATALWFAYP